MLHEIQELKRSSERDQQTIASMSHRAQTDRSDHDHSVQTAKQQLENVRQQLTLAQSTNEELNAELTLRVNEINVMRGVEKDTLAAQQQQLADLKTTLSNTKAHHEKTLVDLHASRMKTR